RGSAGVDVEIAVDYTVIDTLVHCIPSKLQRPLGHNLCALLLGCSSTSRKGVFVLPGVIDADFTGTTGIMVQTWPPPTHIPKGSKIAQLIPFEAKVPQAHSEVRGDQGWGSTGMPEIYFALDILKNKPEVQVTLKEPGGEMTPFCVLIDTGADVTTIP
ncbi:POK9 protein, partial [Pterocles burchelli]|nr:POK9 protein [Pterocles burchelli]